MNIELRNKIIAALEKQLNRDPKENEIINAENDFSIMTEIRLSKLEEEINAIKQSKI